jgi:hypothetical protein
VAEKKFPGGPLGFAEGVMAFAESFRLSAKPEFPVVDHQNYDYVAVLFFPGGVNPTIYVHL